MPRLVSLVLLASALLVAGCDSDPQQEIVSINVSGVVSAEASDAPLDSVRAVMVPPPNVGTYYVDEDVTGADGRYELSVETPVLPQGFCEQAGGILFLRDGYQDRIAAFVPPGLEGQAGDDDESIMWISFTCDDAAKSIDVALFDEVPDDTTATG